jgi:benzoyl-CoA reductase/2-hydroxyglutaryl-CoA dehydratase subunit BcrC/BadD/HgdB
VGFLEKESGRRMDWTLLAETMERTDRQIQLVREINELRKASPSPMHPRGFLELMMVDYLFPGQPEAVRYLETLKADLEGMVAAGRGAVSKERFRLMTLFIPPMYLMSFLDTISEEFGVTSVCEPFFTYWRDGHLDPSDPLAAVVEKSYMLPEARMYGPLDERALTAITDCASDYRVDGAIYYADVACRQSCAMIKLFKDRLSDIDVPTLTLDCDVVDPTITSREEVREKMERFFELLEDR